MQKFTSITWKNIVLPPWASTQSLEDILLSRNIEKSQEEILHDPYLLTDMDIAVERIHTAKTQKEKVIIFWDYDVDGVTSTALMMHMLTKLSMTVSYRLPHRVHDGYGLKKYFIDELAEKWVTLIITVDCGSRDAEIISYAKMKGIDMIVTDHHHVPEVLPKDVIALINPHRWDNTYPYTHLSGAGVAYKLVSALAEKYLSPREAKIYLQQCIDIAAIGTVADCMILTWENRYIVKEGLKQLKNSRSRGVIWLIEDRIHEELDADIIGFHIGPRLNAAGRLESPYIALSALLNNTDSVYEILSKLEELNTLRKAKTLEYTQDALENINHTDNLLIYVSDDIDHGIIGIVAGRLAEKYYLPAIVLTRDGDTLVASCRSPDYFSIIDMLEKYKQYFIAFWWHKNAAGFSVSVENFPILQEKILQEVNMLDFSQHIPEIIIDKIVSLDEIGFRFLEQQNRFIPFGMGNPKPRYLIENFIPETFSFLWKGREHLKFTHKYWCKILAFGMWEYYEQIQSALKQSWNKTEKRWISLICELSEDSWNGQRNIMLRVVDIITE